MGRFLVFSTFNLGLFRGLDGSLSYEIAPISSVCFQCLVALFFLFASVDFRVRDWAKWIWERVPTGAPYDGFNHLFSQIFEEFFAICILTIQSIDSDLIQRASELVLVFTSHDGVSVSAVFSFSLKLRIGLFVRNPKKLRVCSDDPRRVRSFIQCRSNPFFLSPSSSVLSSGLMGFDWVLPGFWWDPAGFQSSHPSVRRYPTPWKASHHFFVRSVLPTARACVCVCVRGRERERGGDDRSFRIPTILYWSDTYLVGFYRSHFRWRYVFRRGASAFVFSPARSGSRCPSIFFNACYWGSIVIEEKHIG